MKLCTPKLCYFIGLTEYFSLVIRTECKKNTVLTGYELIYSIFKCLHRIVTPFIQFKIVWIRQFHKISGL